MPRRPDPDIHTPTTLVMPYYENPGMLEFHYNYLRALPANMRELISLVIVDDGSPNNPAKPPEGNDLGGINFQLYRVDVDTRWGQHAARNIGMNHIETNWALMTDIDHVVPEATWKELLFRKWDLEFVLMFQRVTWPELTPYKHHPNSFFQTLRSFHAAGGYDERFLGYYGTDSDYRHRLGATVMDKTPVTIKEGKVTLWRVPRTAIPDASTTTYLRKQEDDRTIPKQIKAKRGKARPITMTQPYHRVWPPHPEFVQRNNEPR